MSNISIFLRQLHVRRRDYVHIRATINISKLCKHQTLHLIYSEQTIHWGIIHFKVTHRFKNYIHITFVDAKYNFCDLCVLFFKKTLSTATWNILLQLPGKNTIFILDSQCQFKSLLYMVCP